MANEKETPYVTAFLLLLKILNYPIPEHFGDLFTMCQRISSTLHLASYSIDMIMDHNPASYVNGAGNQHNTYDFIIAGGGTAGSLLAMRLLNTKNRYKILVLEAGAEPTWLTNSPFFNTFQWKNNATDWDYHSIPQRDSCIACRKRKIKYLRGKSLGGTMNLGHSIYSRGNPLDFANWANITGDETWTYDSLIKHFKKTENYRGKFDDSSNHGYSTTGTMKISSQGVQPLVKEWVDGGAELGLNTTDPNEFQSQTFAPIEVTIYEGKRENTYDTILKKEIWRKNLKITRYTTVLKVVFDSKHYAKGVVYRRNHQEIEVRATKEVILCAGVFNTPKILMMSGIGPSQHLRDMGIKVKKNLELVGHNFHDQPTTFYGPVTVVHDKTFLPKRNLTYSTIMEYYVNQSGILGANMMSGIGYYSTPSNKEKDWPNIQYTLFPVGIDRDTHAILNSAFDLKHGYLEKYLRDHKDNDAVWVGVTLARPVSRGTVRLKNKEFHSHPSIDPNWFADKQDMANLVEGIQLIQKLFDTGPWSNLDAKLVSTQFPGCERYKLKTPHYYECFANHFTISMGNAGGTCKMGKTKDDSVVNSKLLVHKVKRLRIVDASVMPAVPNGYTGTSVMMVAEKAAEMILEKWTHEVARHRDRSESGSDE